MSAPQSPSPTPTSTSTPNSGTDHVLLSAAMSGWLYKRRGGFGKHMPNAWQLRYFVVNNGYLIYYDSKDTSQPERGKIDLTADINIEFSGPTTEGAPTNYLFQIIPHSTAEEKWKLCAESLVDHQAWAQVFTSFHGSKSVNGVPLRMAVKASTSATSLLELNADGTNAKATTNHSGTTSSNPVHVHSAAAAAATTGAVQRPKKTLRLKEGSFMSGEQLELVCVIAIVNLSLLMFHYSSTMWISGVYLLVMNTVVVQTMILRSNRTNNELVKDKGKISNEDLRLQSNDNVGATVGIAADGSISNAVAASSGRPKAGCTLPFTDGVSPNVPINSWGKTDHRHFKLRIGPNYDRNKQKAPSGPPLYEIFAVDAFCTDKRIDDVTSRMELPDTSDLDIANPHVPPIFVVQVQMPSEPPPSILRSVEDGPGWALVLYFKMTQETCNELKDLSTASAGVKLFATWCEKAPTDPAWKSRFKVIASCLNMEELGMPSMVISYNAKPVLIRRTSSLFKTPKYLETCIHVFKFDYVAKQSILMVTSRCGLMYMECGFTIEGRDDSELPEVLIGCAAINRPQEKELEYLFE